MSAHYIRRIYTVSELYAGLIINELNELKGIGEIFEKYKKIFRSKNILQDFIDAEVIDKYGLQNLIDYYYGYYTKEYNDNYRWGSTCFKKFWRDHNFIGLYNRKGKSVLKEIALSCFINFKNEFSLVPNEYKDYIYQCVKNNEIMIKENYEYSNVPNCTKAQFLNHFLITNFSANELKDYIVTVTKPLIDNKTTGPIIVMEYIFGTVFQVKKNMRDIYALVVEVTFRQTYRYNTSAHIENLLKTLNLTEDDMDYYKDQVWDDASKIKNIWKVFSHDEIDTVLGLANSLFMQSRERFSKSRILEKIYCISYSKSIKYTNTIIDGTDCDGYKNKRIQHYYKNQLQWLIEGNIEEIRTNKNQWRLYSFNMQSIMLKVLNFEGIPQNIKEDLQFYSRFNYKQDYNVLCKLSDTVYYAKAIIKRYKIKSVSEITEEILLKWMHICENDGYSGNTIRNAIYKIKEFIDFLNTTEKYKECPTINPANNIHVLNAHKNTKHTPYIPPEIRIAIENHIDEVDLTTQLCFYIISETGLRFRDQMNTTIKDVVLEPENKSMARFYYFNSKTRRRRIQSEQFEQRFVHISIDLYNMIQNYISETDYIRQEFGTDMLLINTNKKGQLCAIYPVRVVNKINALIDKYNIITSLGEPWHFTNKQLRKAAAVDLISNGASLYNVKTLLDHLSTQTTEIYYAEVDKLKVMELNTEFFKNKFKIFSDEKNLEYFTEEERKVLYIDFLRQHREVEFGMCCKHQSEGSCKHIGNNMCATCPKLITGRKYLPKWSSLFNDSDKRVKEMENIYINHGIDTKEYIHFKEYDKEVKLRARYKSVVDAINVIED